ncbi:MAG: formate dehydrogenase [Alphaproteobacteria bacterium]|nr:formate dehydrogenase [Alphaproteobacteria bacterium]
MGTKVEGANRRTFLKTFGGAATIAAAAATAPLAVREAAAEENDSDKKKARYRETDHVKAFYRTNRY